MCGRSCVRPQGEEPVWAFRDSAECTRTSGQFITGLTWRETRALAGKLKSPIKSARMSLDREHASSTWRVLELHWGTLRHQPAETSKNNSSTLCCARRASCRNFTLLTTGGQSAHLQESWPDWNVLLCVQWTHLFSHSVRWREYQTVLFYSWYTAFEILYAPNSSLISRCLVRSVSTETLQNRSMRTCW